MLGPAQLALVVTPTLYFMRGGDGDGAGGISCPKPLSTCLPKATLPTPNLVLRPFRSIIERHQQEAHTKDSSNATGSCLNLERKMHKAHHQTWCMHSYHPSWDKLVPQATGQPPWLILCCNFEGPPWCAPGLGSIKQRPRTSGYPSLVLAPASGSVFWFPLAARR